MSAPENSTALKEKMRELFEAVSGLLESELVNCMDSETLEQLTRMRDVVQAWIQGDSTLTDTQMLTTIAQLTAALGHDKTCLIDASNRSLH